jgi:hypothetical protein
MKTAVASPDEGPDKKKYGIPPKDKKGLPKKNEYEYKSEQYKKEKPNTYDKPMKGDPSKFGKHEEWMNKPPKDKPKPSTPKSTQLGHKRSQMQEEKKRTIKMPKDYKPKPKSAEPKSEEYLNLKKRREADRQAMRKVEPPTIKKDYKVVENKIKKPEDKKKENKITKKASRSKTPIRMKNKKAK